MPFTPFHFGPGVALHALAPKHLSFLSFCTANVLIDVEPLYYILTSQFPLHRFFHTYIGATVVMAFTVFLFAVLRPLAVRWPSINLSNWRALSLPAIVFGAATGVYSHIILDSIMHYDIKPLAPFSTANALLHLISLGALHLSCVAAGVAGFCLLGVRRLIRNNMSKNLP